MVTWKHYLHNGVPNQLKGTSYMAPGSIINQYKYENYTTKYNLLWRDAYVRVAPNEDMLRQYQEREGQHIC